ncbi:hypothetical protein Acr_00g0065620 [Actinidia rufa]|uniref:Uncharacterized protein n=1 Tax=Actinidia rufa TaxID=165716 RepID=A0A7J0DRA1_9ERIC|nr:hypothetical protein Acr_00g0065620 [Actinidia rufa]
MRRSASEGVQKESFPKTLCDETTPRHNETIQYALPSPNNPTPPKTLGCTHHISHRRQSTAANILLLLAEYAAMLFLAALSSFDLLLSGRRTTTASTTLTSILTIITTITITIY